MTHARQKIRLGLACALSRGLGLLQFRLHPLALRDVARCGEDALQVTVSVVKGGRVVGHHRLLAVAGTRRQLVVDDRLFAQHELDRRLGPLWIGEIVLKRRADQLVTRAIGERLHLLVDVGNDTGGIGGHDRVGVGFDQRAGVELLVAQALIELFLLGFDQLARAVVGANQQIADDGVLRVAQCGDGHHRREPAPILADVGQFVDILDAARGLEDQRLEAWCDRGCELDAQRLGTRDQLLRIGNVSRRDLVHHFGSRVAKHPLGADVEDLDDTLRVGGDAGEVGAVENRALQGPRLELGTNEQIADDGVLRDAQDAIIGYLLIGTELKAGALQSAIFNSANFSSIATDAKGVIQIFNVGAERMLGYAAAEVMNKITPADISDPQELIARAKELSVELGTPITPGFEALVFKASRGIEDIYELTYIRKDGSRFPAVVSVTALRDTHDHGGIIGYLLIGTDNTARKLAEEALLKAGALQSAIFNSANFSSIATDAKGVIQIFNVGAERMLRYTAAEVMNKITPADISDPQELIARAEALSIELGAAITPGFEALVFKASRGIEDIYELTYIRKDGSRFPAVVSVTALRDAEDTIIGYLLIGTDNTARKLVEAEQKKLDQRLRDQQFYTRSLIESNIDALMTTDPSGIITDVNKQMEALTG